MLTSLRITNFAVIDRLTIELGPGLNVLTGETGAGKSIVVGALGLLLGERASVDLVRAGADRAVIEGVFEIEPRGAVLDWLEERGVDTEEGVLILKREVSAEGRSRAWINGSPVTVGSLGELGAHLVSIHGQREHQTLLRREEQRAILDAYGGCEPLAAEVRELHRSHTRLTREIEQMEERKRQALQRADYLRFQVEEIEAAALREGEEEELEEVARRLSHAEELMQLAGRLLEAIGEGEHSAAGRLGSARRTLDQLVRIDPAQNELSELFDTAYYAVEEMSTRLEQYLGLVEHDPARLEQIRARQDLLFRLRSKYGPTIADVLQTLQSAKAELALLEDADLEITGLQQRRDALGAQLAERAALLSKRRTAAAAALAREVDAVLPQLGMVGGRFQAIILPTAEVGAAGAEEVEFRISLNRGFEPKQLAQVASGGELSRVMLALATILARLDAVPTLLFDEIDAGIGGSVALQVGEKMRRVADHHQVLAVTHLPQIASRAHRHLLVRKDDRSGMTTTTVSTLAEDDRTREIARMLGGDPESAASIAHAEELIQKAGLN